MFKKLLLTCLLLSGCLSTNAQLFRTFSSYPRATTLGDSDLLLTSFYSAGSYTTNKAISFTNLVTQLSGILGGGSSVYVNGASVDAPNFATGTNVIVAVSATTNIYFFPTNIVNAQIEASAALDRSKIANGTADHIVINSGAGALSSEATLGATRFPALTGDITTPGGSLATTLANSGVSAGVYGNGAYIPQITVDAKGRLTSVTTNVVTGGGANWTAEGTTNSTLAGAARVHDLVATNSITTGTSGTGQIDIGSAGVRITDDGDGAITFLGLGNGSDEDLTINLDDTSNTATVSSSTSLATINFSSISLQSSGVAIPTTSSTDTLQNKTIASPTVTGAITLPDNTRQTFNPGADAAGINVGSHAGDPGTPSNGDLWYDSSANELTARINGANVALGSGSSGDTIEVVVTASDQAVTSSTTLVDANDLSVAVAANKTYSFRAVLFITQAGTTAGIKLGVTCPASPTQLYAMPLFMAANNASPIANGNPITASGGSLSRGITQTGTLMQTIEGVLVNGANSGDLKIQFAQSTSDANATTLEAGSYLRVELTNP